MPHFPAVLNPGDTIGVCTPSSYIEKDVLEGGVARIKEYGFKVKVHPQSLKRLGATQLAATGTERAAALHDLYRDDDVKVIMTARGGNGATQLLEHLDFDLIAAHPKPLIGYSDTTALTNAIYGRAGGVGYQGPTPSWFHKRFDAGQADHFWALMGGKMNEIALPGCTVLRPGTTRGQLVGGNLSVLDGLLNTPYAPPLNGAILMIEDVWNELNNFDRVLTHWRYQGLFDRIGGLLCGDFTDMRDTGDPYGFTVEDIIRAATDGFDIPVILNAPFGHGGRLLSLPIGLPVTLSAQDGRVLLSA